MRLYSLGLLIIGVSFHLYAQTTPTIVTSSVSGGSACAGATLSVGFSTSNLNISKRSFSVQLSALGGAFTNFTTLATAKTSPITITLPASTPTGDYKLRVITDTTGVTYTPSNTFTILRPPTAKLSGDTTITAGGTATLTLSFTGNGPWTYTFTNTNTGTASTNPFKGIVQPTITTAYSLQSVSNACGAGTISGSATVTVIPRITANYTATNVCVGDNVQVPFAVLGTVGGTSTIYTAQLSDANGNFNTPTTIGTATSTPIVAKIPTNIVAGSNYKIRVIANATTTSISGNSLIVKPLPAATISGSTTIEAGTATNLTLSFTGDAPWTYELSDGKTATVTTSPTSVSVNPLSNTTYSLKSVSNACGTGTIAGSAVVTVIPRISVAEVALGSVCVGTNVNLPFTVVGTMPTGTVYTAQISDANGSFTNPINLASGSGNPLIFPLPTILVAGNNYKLRVIANTSSNYISSQPFIIKPLPTATISGNSTVNFGETASVTLSFTGDAPWTYTLSNGTIGTADRSPSTVIVTPTQTSNYQVASVKNICGTGVGAGVAAVAVIPRLVTENFTQIICIGNPFDVKFSLGGVLPLNVTYQAQLSDNMGSFANATLIGSGTKSPISATLPTGLNPEGNYKVRVVAVGATINSVPNNSFQVGRVPTANLSGGGNFPIKPGDEITLIIKFTGDAPWTYVLSDNSTATVSTTPTIFTVNPTLPTTYTLKSVSNLCGLGTVSGSAVANVIITSANILHNESIVSPNPFTNRLSIRPKNTIYQYQIVDFTGRVWQEERVTTPSDFEIVTPTLASGIYLLQLYDGIQWQTQKIIKQP